MLDIKLDWLLSTLYLLSLTVNMLGGTIVAALDLIKERGVDNKHIKVVSRHPLKLMLQSVVLRQ